MVDRSDRHFRRMIRALTRETLVYTPMITTHAILRGDRERILAFDPVEHPLSLQLGGDDPRDLARCAQIAEALGYDEVNLNVGCPSSRVQGGNFGAILMRDPPRVAACVAAMREAVSIEVTVKHRIGVDEIDRYEDMLEFVDTVAQSGARRFTVHARKAWLSGLSPKQNRNVPPLRHAEVHRLKRERPELWIETNGGITDLDAVETQLESVDAVMIGRAAWDTPMIFAAADRRIFASAAPDPEFEWVVREYASYAARELAAGTRPVGVLRNFLNLAHGRPGARRFKRGISALAQRPPEGAGALETAIDALLAELRELAGSGCTPGALAPP